MRAAKPMARVTLMAAFLVAVLSGCYLPLRFDAEIELSRRGYYSIIFDGYVTWVPLFDELRKGELSEKQEKKKSEQIVRDLARDSAATEVKYLKNGVFKLHWEKSGDLFRSSLITFVRRNAAMLSISFVKKKGLVTLRGTDVGKSNAKKLVAMGLGIDGELRVKTDGRVISHNATKKRKITEDGRTKMLYIWKIKSLFERAPELVMVLR